MKIVYCILGTFNSGGMERVLTNKANYLVSQGHEITIITSDQKSRPNYFPLDPRVKQVDLGINYTDYVDQKFLKKFFDYRRLKKKHTLALRDALFQIRPDITISMFDYEAAMLPKINDGSAKVLEIHFSRYKRLQYGRKGIMGLVDSYLNGRDQNIVVKYDRFVVLTEEDKGYWGDLHNIEVIPNANSFEPQSTAELNDKRVIAVGRYDFQKGFDDLIQIWKAVHQQVPEYKLDIFGRGPLEGELQTLIQELKLQDTVFLRSPVKDIASEYLKSACVVMSSRYEGLPMALLEGQVCGLPMVSYTCKCGPKDIITDGVNGFLVPEGDKELFASRLVQVLKDEELRRKMGQDAKEMSARFSEAEVMKKWLTLFNSVKK